MTKLLQNINKKNRRECTAENKNKKRENKFPFFKNKLITLKNIIKDL